VGMLSVVCGLLHCGAFGYQLDWKASCTSPITYTAHICSRDANVFCLQSYADSLKPPSVYIIVLCDVCRWMRIWNLAFLFIVPKESNIEM
jgi:hypothetical protein